MGLPRRPLSFLSSHQPLKPWLCIAHRPLENRVWLQGTPLRLEPFGTYPFNSFSHAHPFQNKIKPPSYLLSHNHDEPRAAGGRRA